RERVSVVRPAVEQEGAQARVERRHDLPAASDHSNWEAPADRLSKHGEVRLHAENGLEAADGEARVEHLVDDEVGAVPVGQSARGREELWRPGDRAVAQYRLE